MTEVKNCLLPDDLFYSVEHNLWVRDLKDGTAEVGMTDIAQTMAGAIIHCTPKAAGKKVKKGKSLATVESGKWVGPVRSPFTGEIVAMNEGVQKDPPLLNRSPYKGGWIVRIRPQDMAADMAELLQGEKAADEFSRYMEEKGLGECIHCEGYEG
jgi:glycine cleavage system H protein